MWETRTNLVDKEGDEINATGHALDVVVQDQYSEVVDLYFGIYIDALTVITNGQIDDRTLTVFSDTTPLVGHMICLREGTHIFQTHILAVVVNGVNWDVTIDSPLDFAYTTVSGCALMSSELTVDGSVTPIIAFISPVFTQVDWDITRLMFHIQDTSAMDSNTFGGLPKLTNGLITRLKNSVTKNLMNIKSNGDFADRAFDVTYDTRAPAGLYGFNCRSTYAGQDKRGVTLRLEYATADQIQLIIQDDLTGLNDFHVIAQGHVVE